MEKRIGTITILIRAREAASAVTGLLSEYSNIILCRQGLPYREREVAVISLIVEGSVDSINALTGKLGRVEGVECKAVVTKNS